MVKTVNVKNRSTGSVFYQITESGIRRNWSPGEVKRNISVDELEQATYTPGVTKLMNKYLVINDKEVCEHLGLDVEPEYFYDEKEVKELLTKGTLDQFLDCLDFAPQGVLEMIKTEAIKMKLNDVSKRDAIKKALGFDVTAAIANVEYSESEDTTKKENKTGRRSKPIQAEDKEPAKRGRRASTVKNTEEKKED